MSVFAVHQFCHRLSVDAEHRLAAQADLAAVLQRFNLTEAEREAITAGDVAQLWRWGVHPLLLVRMCAYGIAGLNKQTYSTQIRRCLESAK